MAILVSSHILAEIERVAHRVAILLRRPAARRARSLPIPPVGSKSCSSRSPSRRARVRAASFPPCSTRSFAPCSSRRSPGSLIGVFLGLMGYSFTLTLFNNRYATLVHIFFQAAALLLLIVPIDHDARVRRGAAQRNAGAAADRPGAREPCRARQVPRRPSRCVLVMIALTAATRVVLGLYGTPDWGPIYSGYLGLGLLASALVAARARCSGADGQPGRRGDRHDRASRSCSGCSIRWPRCCPTTLERVLISLSLLARFTPFATGAMYLSDLGFFVSVTALALFLAMRALARR